MLLVDTYNVLHITGVLSPDLAGLDAGDLAALIGTSRYADRTVKLICDGGRPGESPHQAGIEFVFAGPGREADELIERIIRTNSAPKRLLVVSSDRRVIAAARRRRAAILSSERFLAQLALDRERPRRSRLPAFVHEIPLDRYSVASWMREFGLDAGDLERTHARPSGPRKPDADTFNQPPPGSDAPAVEPPTSPSADAPDPVLRDAQREWPGQIGPDDLDMRTWLGEANRAARGRAVPPRGRGRRLGR
jgi:predicted RNA-binding protein with PIN domain